MFNVINLSECQYANEVTEAINIHRNYRSNWGNIIDSFISSNAAAGKIDTDEYDSPGSLAVTIRQAVIRRGLDDIVGVNIINSKVYLIRKDFGL